MSAEAVGAIGAVVVAVLGSVIAWLVSDAKSKERSHQTNREVEWLKKKTDEISRTLTDVDKRLVEVTSVHSATEDSLKNHLDNDIIVHRQMKDELEKRVEAAEHRLMSAINEVKTDVRSIIDRETTGTHTRPGKRGRP